MINIPAIQKLLDEGKIKSATLPYVDVPNPIQKGEIAFITCRISKVIHIGKDTILKLRVPKKHLQIGPQYIFRSMEECF